MHKGEVCLKQIAPLLCCVVLMLDQSPNTHAQCFRETQLDDPPPHCGSQVLCWSEAASAQIPPLFNGNLESNPCACKIRAQLVGALAEEELQPIGRPVEAWRICLHLNTHFSRKGVVPNVLRATVVPWTSC